MRSILVHATSFERHTPALEFGVRLAAASGASVTGVYAYEDPLYTMPPFNATVIDELEAKIAALLQSAVSARQPFLDWAASLKVPAAEWLVARGPIEAALVQAATCRDLLVLDHTEARRAAHWDVAGLILRAGVPCIVVPPRTVPAVHFKRIVVAWNGSPEAMRAVHSAVSFLAGAQVLLLRGEERALEPGVDWDPPFDIRQYLRARRVDAEPRLVSAGPDAVGASLLEAATHFGADLLVMGAYGRSRFSEWVLGGATRDVLAHAEIPVLLQH